MIRIIKDKAPEFWTNFFRHNKNVRRYVGMVKYFYDNHYFDEDVIKAGEI